MSWNDILCKFYYLKELVDENKDTRNFEIIYSESLSESEKRKYIWERNLYDYMFTRQDEVNQYAYEIEEYSTFDIGIISDCLIRILQADQEREFIGYYSPLMVPSARLLGRRKYEYEQKTEFVIVPVNSDKTPKKLGWYENNTHTYETDVGMFSVCGTRVEAPTVPNEFAYNDILMIGSKEDIYMPRQLSFYVYFGYGLFPNYFINGLFNSHVLQFIDSLILYRVNGNMKTISSAQINEFCTAFIEEEILKHKRDKDIGQKLLRK